MTQKEQELVDKYVAFKKTEDEARRNGMETLRELATLAPHKVGEIIKWQEVKRERVGGRPWNPIYKDLPPVEKTAVLSRVTANVMLFGENDIYYKYEFNSIKKDGCLSQNNTRPQCDYEWTGEMYNEPKTE
jgi:hypothetical protein